MCHILLRRSTTPDLCAVALYGGHDDAHGLSNALRSNAMSKQCEACRHRTQYYTQRLGHICAADTATAGGGLAKVHSPSVVSVRRTVEFPPPDIVRHIDDSVVVVIAL